MKLVKEKQFNKTLFIAIVFIVLGLIAMGSILSARRQKQEKLAVIQTPTRETPVPTEVMKSGWKTFENDKLQISYPADWRIDTNTHDITTLVSFTSSDYKQSIVGYPKKGYGVGLYYKQVPWDESIGLKSTQKVQWLSQSAKLQKYMFDSNVIALTATFSGVPMQMVLSSAPDTQPEIYSDLLLRVANTLKIKNL